MSIVGACRIWTAAVIGTFGLSTIVGAQTNEETFQQFQWNFSTPGARANGMGRAFIGVADDATAAVTNPAGLVTLTKPQLYVELKSTDIQVDRLATPDSLVSHQTTTFGGVVNSASFLSLSAPIGRRIAVSFTRHQFLNYQERFELSKRPLPGIPFSLFPVNATTDFRGSSYSGSIAASLTDKVRVGLTISENQLTANSQLNRLNFAGSEIKDVPVGAQVSHATIGDKNRAASYAVGAQVRPHETLSVGVVYAKGPSFELMEDAHNNIGKSFAGFPRTISIHVPDRVGVGLAARPQSRLLVTFDAVHIKYSSLTKNFTDVFNEGSSQDFRVNDATELHLGGEFNVSRRHDPIFIRAGVFSNPDHSLTFVPDPKLLANDNVGNINLFNLLSRKTQVKGTIGTGFVVGRHFQADFAYLWTKEFVASTGIRF